LEIQWRKRRRPSISKIFKINLEKLIEKLKSKWKIKEDEAVAKIRASRQGENWWNNQMKPEGEIWWIVQMKADENNWKLMDIRLDEKSWWEQMNKELENNWEWKEELKNNGVCETNIINENEEGDIIPSCDKGDLEIKGDFGDKVELFVCYPRLDPGSTFYLN